MKKAFYFITIFLTLLVVVPDLVQSDDLEDGTIPESTTTSDQQPPLSVESEDSDKTDETSVDDGSAGVIITDNQPESSEDSGPNNNPSVTDVSPFETSQTDGKVEGDLESSPSEKVEDNESETSGIGQQTTTNTTTTTESNDSVNPEQPEADVASESPSQTTESNVPVTTEPPGNMEIGDIVVSETPSETTTVRTTTSSEKPDQTETDSIVTSEPVTQKTEPVESVTSESPTETFTETITKPIESVTSTTESQSGTTDSPIMTTIDYSESTTESQTNLTTLDDELNKKPKMSFWGKIFSLKGPYSYLSIGLFGFIFVALLIMAYSRLFVHSQQCEEYNIERGRDTSRFQSLQLNLFKRNTEVVVT